jgi:5-methylcytosine-specific restriction endonuclease McrA
MPFTRAELKNIYDRTSGYCHICHRKMSFTNYGRPRERGAWEIEHSVPQSKGGTDHGNNLFGAHITCNREKSNYTTQTARRWHGTSRAPLSRKKKQQERASNTAGGALIGGLVGLAGGGPIGAVLGALGGAAIGNSIKPK